MSSLWMFSAIPIHCSCWSSFWWIIRWTKKRSYLGFVDINVNSCYIYLYLLRNGKSSWGWYWWWWRTISNNKEHLWISCNYSSRLPFYPENGNGWFLDCFWRDVLYSCWCLLLLVGCLQTWRISQNNEQLKR